jgi:hypothetical protein
MDCQLAKLALVLLAFAAVFGRIEGICRMLLGLMQAVKREHQRVLARRSSARASALERAADN